MKICWPSNSGLLLFMWPHPSMTSMRDRLVSLKWLAMEESRLRFRRTCGMRSYQYTFYIFYINLTFCVRWVLMSFISCPGFPSAWPTLLPTHPSSYVWVLPRPGCASRMLLQSEITPFYQVLCALEVAGHYDTIGKQLMQYITLFFPRHIKRFRAQRYADRVSNS